MASTYEQVAEEIYGCSLLACPVNHRIDLPGHYPKFGAGGTAVPRLALITMNPGGLDGRRPSDRLQAHRTRDDLTRVEMHALYSEGLIEYHRQPRGGSIDLVELVETEAGLSWNEVYYTEVAKCITNRDERDTVRPDVLRCCSESFLTDELISLGQQLRVAICLGNDAFGWAGQIIRQSSVLRAHLRVLKVRHPANDYSREFEPQLRSALRQARSLLGDEQYRRTGERDTDYLDGDEAEPSATGDASGFRRSSHSEIGSLFERLSRFAEQRGPEVEMRPRSGGFRSFAYRGQKWNFARLIEWRSRIEVHVLRPDNTFDTRIQVSNDQEASDAERRIAEAYPLASRPRPRR